MIIGEVYDLLHDEATAEDPVVVEHIIHEGVGFKAAGVTERTVRDANDLLAWSLIADDRRHPNRDLHPNPHPNPAGS